jgi:aryl-alcohol dehydrogenase-like predicted oxidoreductase
LARGALSRPAQPGVDATKTLREETDDIPASTYFQIGAGTKAVVDRYVFISPQRSDLTLISCSVEEIAKKHGATMSQIALAWVMAKDGAHRLPLHTLLLTVAR